MKLYKKADFKISQKIEVPEEYKKLFNGDIIYLVPTNKNYNSIKPDINNRYNTDHKKPIAFLKNGNRNYNGILKIFENGLFAQYRDGCFYEYVGKVAI